MSAPDRNSNVTAFSSLVEARSNEIVDKRGKTNSVVWKWFGYRTSDKLRVSACCKMCRRVVPTSSGNTSNLFHHLKQFHPIEHSESQKMRHHKSLSQPETIPSSSSPKPAVSIEKPMQQTQMAAFMPYDKQSKRHKDITKAVTNFLAKDMMSFSTVENTVYFPEDHTGEAIADGLADALASWGLREDRQVCITTDSGTNIIKAAELNRWTRLQCFGHRLNSAIEKVIQDKRVDRAIGICKKVVAAFSYSWKKKRDLAAAQEEYHLPKHKLISETPTRWGSRQQMVKRVLEQKRAITEVLSKDKKTRPLVPTWQDVDVLESIDAADPTMDDLLNMACLVDPRFKLQYTQEEKREYIKEKAVLEMLKGERSVVVREEESREEAMGDTSVPAKKTKLSLASFFSNGPTTTTSTEDLSAQQAVERELGNYLLSPNADNDSNPLDWWKVYQKNFPRVSQLAQHYLCIQATSSPSERVFSTGGNIVTCKRASLKPDNVDQLVFLARNL
ncbi:zinc finger BED domain-containing protein 4-like [Xyrauchen texanus]|uniref:zinc finger BED domain-containing protein 4-like n=1 Tax=Xyrauchen texanus TaxID=154827 RepID=UPI0022428F93|nr:zinc finger BED domain-containing protein 4-like [Xyrauchen texanus]